MKRVRIAYTGIDCFQNHTRAADGGNIYVNNTGILFLSNPTNLNVFGTFIKGTSPAYHAVLDGWVTVSSNKFFTKIVLMSASQNSNGFVQGNPCTFQILEAETLAGG